MAYKSGGLPFLIQIPHYLKVGTELTMLIWLVLKCSVDKITFAHSNMFSCEAVWLLLLAFSVPLHSYINEMLSGALDILNCYMFL